MASIPPPDDAKISAFWSWFAGTAKELGDNLDNDRLLEELDVRVSQLGDVAWEVGPGTTAANALAISPDGVAEMLPVTQRIVSMAPAIPGWEILPARPVRSPNLTFSITNSEGVEIEIDAREWRYVLYRSPEGTFDIVVEVSNVRTNEDDRYTAAVLLLDGILGEATRLLRIRDVEPVVAMSQKQLEKSNSVTVLAQHLRSRMS